MKNFLYYITMPLWIVPVSIMMLIMMDVLITSKSTGKLQSSMFYKTPKGNWRLRNQNHRAK